MQVREWMTRNVVTVSPDTSLLNARRLLETYEIRHLPVVADGTVVGIVSSRDICSGDRTLNAALAALRSDLAEGRFRPVSTLMSTPVRSVAPDTPVREAGSLMVAARIGAVPVVEDGRLVGLLSLVDCLRAYLAWEEEQERRSGGQPAPADDPDRWLRIPLPPGDARPGRSPRPRPVDQGAAAAQGGPPPSIPGRKAG